MRADDDGERAIGQTRKQAFPLTCGTASDEQTDFYAKRSQQLGQGMMMLSGENFGRSHQASLTAIVQSQQHGQQGYQSFTATHIALHQSVHLMSAEGILPDLPYHLFLRTGQFERQMFLVECIE